MHNRSVGTAWLLSLAGGAEQVNGTQGESHAAPAPALQTGAAGARPGSDLWCSAEVPHRDRTESTGGDTVGTELPPHWGSKFTEQGTPPGSPGQVR